MPGLQWRMPSQLVFSNDPLVREVISGALLREHLGCDYLHRGVAAALNQQLLQSLGVQSLTTQQLIEVGKSIVERLNDSKTGKCLRSIGFHRIWYLMHVFFIEADYVNKEHLSCVANLVGAALLF